MAEWHARSTSVPRVPGLTLLLAVRWAEPFVIHARQLMLGLANYVAIFRRRSVSKVNRKYYVQRYTCCLMETVDIMTHVKGQY